MTAPYRIYIRRDTSPVDWELVAGTETATDANEIAAEWIDGGTAVGVRIDQTVRMWLMGRDF